MSHKAGFVNIIGHPNVGKSTLMNLLIGEKLSIITPKAQTTRHRILGIVNGEDYQIIFSDTPGILKPFYKLHQSMMKFIESALKDADIFLYMVEAGESAVEEEVLEKIKKSKKPFILIINKTDLLSVADVEGKVAFWEEKLPGTPVVPISALHNSNIEKLEKLIIENLPESPPYYPKDELTDKNVRFFVSEIIREKIFLFYRQEVPYSCEVAVEGYTEKEDIHVINATIYLERESQKAILLGHQGKAIRKVGIEARKDIEKLVGCKVYLELTVKVSSDWRENELQLKRFGYEI
jgi:GTPase